MLQYMEQPTRLLSEDEEVVTERRRSPDEISAIISTYHGAMIELMKKLCSNDPSRVESLARGQLYVDHVCQPIFHDPLRIHKYIRGMVVLYAFEQCTLKTASVTVADLMEAKLAAVEIAKLSEKEAEDLVVDIVNSLVIVGQLLDSREYVLAGLGVIHYLPPKPYDSQQLLMTLCMKRDELGAAGLPGLFNGLLVDLATTQTALPLEYIFAIIRASMLAHTLVKQPKHELPGWVTFFSSFVADAPLLLRTLSARASQLAVHPNAQAMVRDILVMLLSTAGIPWLPRSPHALALLVGHPYTARHVIRIITEDPALIASWPDLAIALLETGILVGADAYEMIAPSADAILHALLQTFSDTTAAPCTLPLLRGLPQTTPRPEHVPTLAGLYGAVITRHTQPAVAFLAQSVLASLSPVGRREVGPLVWLLGFLTSSPLETLPFPTLRHEKGMLFAAVSAKPARAMLVVASFAVTLTPQSGPDVIVPVCQAMTALAEAVDPPTAEVLMNMPQLLRAAQTMLDLTRMQNLTRDTKEVVVPFLAAWLPMLLTFPVVGVDLATIHVTKLVKTFAGITMSQRTRQDLGMHPVIADTSVVAARDLKRVIDDGARQAVFAAQEDDDDDDDLFISAHELEAKRAPDPIAAMLGSVSDTEDDDVDMNSSIESTQSVASTAYGDDDGIAALTAVRSTVDTTHRPVLARPAPMTAPRPKLPRRAELIAQAEISFRAAILEHDPMDPNVIGTLAARVTELDKVYKDVEMYRDHMLSCVIIETVTVIQEDIKNLERDADVRKRATQLRGSFGSKTKVRQPDGRDLQEFEVWPEDVNVDLTTFSRDDLVLLELAEFDQTKSIMRTQKSMLRLAAVNTPPKPPQMLICVVTDTIPASARKEYPCSAMRLLANAKRFEKCTKSSRKQEVRLHRLSSASSAQREVTALYLARLLPDDWMNALLQGKNAAKDVPRSIEGLPSDIVTTTAFNKVQRQSIEDVVSPTRAITAIQGPPGTGKTHVVVGAILTAHAVRNRRNSGLVATSRPKIMVCAPSNAAVDEITRRMLQHNYARQSRLVLVRVGVYDAISEDVRHCHSTRVGSVISALTRIEGKIEEFEARVAAGYTTTTADRKMLEAEKDEWRETYEHSPVSPKPPANEADQKRALLARADIICTTLSCAGRSIITNGLANQLVTHIFIDEAGQATEPSTLIPLTALQNITKEASRPRIVMLGDPAQLPPTVKNRKAKACHYDTSFLQRLFTYTPGMRMLTTQYRMLPAISKAPNALFYGNRLQDDPSVYTRLGKLSWPHDMARLFGPYTFIDLPDTQEARDPVSGSYSNRREAEVVATIAGTLIEKCGPLRTRLQRSLQQFAMTGEEKKEGKFSASDIGIITPYNRQKDLIRGVLREGSPNWAHFCEIGTVDSFQGREKEIIILSLVRSGQGESSRIGFLGDNRRINVSLTRARRSLIIVGNAENLLKANTVWRTLVEDAKDRGALFTIHPARPTHKVPNNLPKYVFRLDCMLSGKITNKEYGLLRAVETTKDQTRRRDRIRELVELKKANRHTRSDVEEHAKLSKEEMQRHLLLKPFQGNYAVAGGKPIADASVNTEVPTLDQTLEQQESEPVMNATAPMSDDDDDDDSPVDPRLVLMDRQSSGYVRTFDPKL
ncbi:AAA domain [Carpediemonas membranifera]|uniref:AAA domain n=1 Tax=Carpediemonas membranifera TaxID=201153 RepID=A0A8J6AX21_9EUKA|nr:AAA domain [Carpediemonas membranifera]|eukprot:KAG9390468.1 AAA domain [Carpediemonas membranifera]